MTPDQSRMARQALRWTIDDLAAAADIGRATVARFEGGGDASIKEKTVAAMRAALEHAGIEFIHEGGRVGVTRPE